MTDREATARFELLYPLARDPLVLYLARRAAPDAVEDLFAEVMTIAWRRIRDIPDGDELPWLYGVARRVLANHRRASGRLGRLLERIALVERGVDPGRPPESSGDPDLAAALASLPAADAEVLHLWAWEELAPREIARVLDITPNAASIRLHRAKGRLRDALEPGPRKDPEPAGHLLDVERTEAR
jgi:RNA polymerase sigma-70 factor (ECF subfamily)